MAQEPWEIPITVGKYKGKDVTWYQAALKDPGWVCFMEESYRRHKDLSRLGQFITRLKSAMDSLPISTNARCVECGGRPTLLCVAGPGGSVGYSVSVRYVYCDDCTDHIMANHYRTVPIALASAYKFTPGGNREQVTEVLARLLEVPKPLRKKTAWQFLQPYMPATNAITPPASRVLVAHPR